jgi:peptidyl-prolyl cis-trans isomerase C
MERAALIGQRVLEVVAGDVPTNAEAIRARHILCKTRANCEAAMSRLQAGEAFEDVAADVSVDTSSAEQGGDLGWVGRGSLVSQQVEEAVFSLQPGERSGIVETDFGFHIIEVLERDPDHPLTEAQRLQLKEKKLLDWLAEKRDQADIVIYVDDLRAPEGT